MAMALAIQMHSAIQIPAILFNSKSNPNCFSKMRGAPRLLHSAVHYQKGGVFAAGDDLPGDYADWVPERSSDGDRRRAGILLHPTSFPGPYGIGDLGSQALHFLDWLHDSGCSLWQVHFQLL